MRNQFIQLLCTWAREDETIYLLTADLGFSVLEPFSQEFPKRFINVGIAEQNMIGIAAGLSLRGKKFLFTVLSILELYVASSKFAMIFVITTLMWWLLLSAQGWLMG